LKENHCSVKANLQILGRISGTRNADCALDVDYANVKDKIVPAGDDLRQDAYYQVWTALYSWQTMIYEEYSK